MERLRLTLVFVCCAWLLACGSSAPHSSLILGIDPPDVSLGDRTLTDSQSHALQAVITSAGQTCGAISHAFLRDLDPAGREAWEVQCDEGRYSVQLRDDGAPKTAVQRCFAGFNPGSGVIPNMGTLCTGAVDGTIHGARRPPEERPLNPDLKKLLDPMTAKDGKTD